MYHFQKYKTGLLKFLIYLLFYIWIFPPFCQKKKLCKKVHLEWCHKTIAAILFFFYFSLITWAGLYNERGRALPHIETNLVVGWWSFVLKYKGLHSAFSPLLGNHSKVLPELYFSCKYYYIWSFVFCKFFYLWSLYLSHESWKINLAIA